MSNLFAGWPKEKLAQVFTSSLPGERRGDFEYRLHPTERLGLGWLRDRVAGENTNPRKAGKASNAHAKATLLPCLRKWLELLPYKLPSRVEEAILQFRPEVVHSCLGNIQIPVLALHCAKLCNVNLIPHFMDDWPSTMYAGRPDLVIQRRLLLSTLQRIMKVAPIGMGISDLMATEYSAAYGVPFYSFMNCTSVAPEIEPMAAPDPTVGPRFIYTGCLHHNRWRSLKEIGDALRHVNSEGIRGKLYVYAPAEDISEFGGRVAGPSVEVVGSLAQHEVMGVMKSGHVMVHVESFERDMRKYTRLSMSTKIPQYMAAGRPIFCYGPSEVASCSFIEENECGIVVGSQNRSELAAAMRCILQDASLRNRLGTKAWAIARQKFTSEDVRERFRDVIAQTAWGRSERQPPVAIQRQKISSHV